MLLIFCTVAKTRFMGLAICATIVTTLIVCDSSYAIAGDHGDADGEPAAHAGHGGHEEGGDIRLTLAQIRAAGIEMEVVKYRPEVQSVHAPGSVDFNGYTLADITTLVDGVIYARHTRLGDVVHRGAELVTLNSSALARSEADYLRAEAEHRKSKLDLQRIKALAGEKIVSQARLQQATSIHQAAHANLAAARAALSSYGLSGERIDSLLVTSQYGKLTLYAPTAGTIISDDFRLGQHVSAGSRLLQIVDESTVWVEVKLPQSQVAGIDKGGAAVVLTKESGRRYPAKVINIHHQLDKSTRTVGVRLEVQNHADALHPGMFVTAEIATDSGGEALLLPAEAVQRQGGELIVFVEEESGVFERREVRVGSSSMGLVPIVEGLREGESVVVKGAFVLASELAKAGFEAHNH
ncbi:MAG: efflux RND transporter periplasmic adaptor subunit [Mariprofundales bacterium]|nr:efflux RND transporter periplasmic adaptor subunit [Mariprofundales bacterium]